MFEQLKLYRDFMGDLGAGGTKDLAEEMTKVRPCTEPSAEEIALAKLDLNHDVYNQKLIKQAQKDRYTL